MNCWGWRQGEWREFAPEPEPLPDELCVVSWNLWMDSHERERRGAGQVAELQALQPHLIGLQEATLRMLDPFFHSEWIRERYWCSASPTSGAATHGVVLFSRLGCERLWLESLPGAMGRRALLADFSGLRLAVVHLESQSKNTEVRQAQLQQLFPLLEEAPAALLMGDFNFCSQWEENARLPANYVDLWASLRPDLPGWSIDTERNPMLLKQERRARQSRYDRMLLRGLQAESLHQVGLEPLAEGLLCSDHFGLSATLRTRFA